MDQVKGCAIHISSFPALTRPIGRSAGLLIALMSSSLVLPAGLSQAAPLGTFSAAAEGLSFTFGAPGIAGPSGIAGGVAGTQATSQPLAKAKGAGTCTDTPTTGQNLIDFINTTLCSINNTEEAEATASGQEVNPLPNPEKCTLPIPATLAGITIGAACGNALARIVGTDPFAEGLGKFAGMDVDIVPLVPGKEMVAVIGRTLSSSFSQNNLVKSRTDVDLGKIGFVTDPLTPNDAGTGLIVIEFSDALAEVTWDGLAASASPDSKAAIVTVKFRPTHISPFTETSLVPGQELTVPGTAGTPAETTIKAGVKKTSVNNEPLKGTSSAEATAFEVHALKGINGGIILTLSRAKATVQGERPAPPPGPLAHTGPVSGLRAAGLLALLAAAVLAASLKRKAV